MNNQEWKSYAQAFLVISFGIKEDIYLYIENQIDFPTVISMAVKSSAEIIDQDFEEVIDNDMNDSSDDEQTE